MINASHSHRMLRKGAMTALPLALTMFCQVSGGPFGLEELVSEVGSGIALLLICVTPIVWALPDALTTAELSTAIPEEGGYIVWVRRAMGPFAAFVNAWWTWIYALVDAAIYPVLFGTYLAGFFKLPVVAAAIAGTPLEAFLRSDWVAGHKGLWQWIVGFAVIVVFTILNVRGTKLVGRASSVFALLLIAPFTLLAGIGAWRLWGQPLPVVHEFVPRGESFIGSASAGLGIVLWNYLGWDGLSTIAEEVDQPQKAYPRALLYGVPLVTLVYLLPTSIGLAFYPDSSKWTEGAWPAIAQAVGGPWLAVVIGFAALVSPIALFTGSLLASSRVPFVIAEAGFLPKGLVAIHPRFGTPYRAILLCGAIYTVTILQSFQSLVKINVVMYAAALVLEILALIILRYKEPDLPRPFRIKGGLPVLILIAVLPITLVCFMTWSDAKDAIEEGTGWITLIATLSALASAPVIYGVVRWISRRKGSEAIRPFKKVYAQVFSLHRASSSRRSLACFR